MARSKSSTRWLHEHFNDPFVKRAQAEGYRSRAVFKLDEGATPAATPEIGRSAQQRAPARPTSAARQVVRKPAKPKAAAPVHAAPSAVASAGAATVTADDWQSF